MVTPKDGKRISKIDMYLNCAENFVYRSTCMKRKYGAVIVKNDVVISTGYNGSPRGFENCCDIGEMSTSGKEYASGRGIWYMSCDSCGGKCAIKLFERTNNRSRFVLNRNKS